MEIYIDDDTKLKLTSLRQNYTKLEDKDKNRKLFGLLDELEFNQVRHAVLTCGLVCCAVPCRAVVWCGAV